MEPGTYIKIYSRGDILLSWGPIFQFFSLSFQVWQEVFIRLPGVGSSHFVVLVKNEMGFEKVKQNSFPRFC